GDESMRRSCIAGDSGDGDIRTGQDRIEANFHENMSVVQNHEPVEVTTNLSDESGLDNVADKRRGGQGRKEVAARKLDHEIPGPTTVIRRSLPESAARKSLNAGLGGRVGGGLATSISKRERRRIRRERARMEMERRASREAATLSARAGELMGDV